MHVNFLPKTLVNSYSPIYFPVYKCNLIHKPECSILCDFLKIFRLCLYPNILKKRHILNKALKAIMKILFQNKTTTTK